MLKTLALAAVGLAFAGGIAFAESPMTREPTTGRSVVTFFYEPLACLQHLQG